MFVYLSVYAFLAALGAVVRENKSTIWLTFALIFLIWFMGARYYVGCDFSGYLNRYEQLPETFNLAYVLSQQEPGFALLIGTIKGFGLEYVWVNVAASAIIVWGLSVFLRNQLNPLMVLALLFPIIILQLGMSGIRQAIAVSMLLVASTHFLNSRRLMTALWIVIGAQFHSSVLLFLPIAFLAGMRITLLRLALGVIILAPVAVIALGERFDVYQDRYIDQIYGTVTSSGAIIRYLMVLAPVLLFLSYFTRIKQALPSHFELLKLFAIIILAMAPLTVLSSIALHRLNYYVMPFSIVMLVNLSYVLFPRSQWQMTKLLPALYYGGYAIFWQVTSSHAASCYQPYQNYTLSAVQ